MKTTVALFVLTLPLLAAAQPQAQAPAQSVWRCGANGSSYSSTPCREGRSVDVPGARPAADVQAAGALAARDRQAADQLQRERLRSEAQNRGNGLAGIPLVRPKVEPAPTVVAAKRHRKTRAPAAAGTWQAVAPVSR